jgi:hypothetical protein
VQRALSLGWIREHIHVIDQDQAHSGSSTIGRDGFQSLVGGQEIIPRSKRTVFAET